MKNKTHPALSVLVPVYNSEKFLRGCLQSIADQTFRDFEVIVVNDGSTDNSEKIIDNFVNKYPNFVKINQQNQGAPTAINTAIETAKGQYLSIIDNDDFIDPKMYEKLFDLLTREPADIARCGFLFFSYPGFELKNRFSYVLSNDSENNSVEFVKDWLKNKTHVAYWLSIYKKELFDDVKFKDGVQIGDIYTMPEIYLKANRIVFIPECLYYYRRREGSLSSKSGIKIEGMQDWVLVVNHLRKIFGNNSHYRELLPAFHQHAFKRIIQFTLSLRSNDIHGLNYNDEHPALKLLSPQLLDELLNSPYISGEEKDLLKKMNESFEAFCIQERVLHYKLNKSTSTMARLIGSYLKIKLKDRELPFNRNKIKKISDQTVLSKDKLSKREYEIVNKYGL